MPKISALPVGTTPAGTEIIPAVQGGVTVSLTATQLIANPFRLEPYTIGDLLYASASTTISKLAAVAVGSVLISGGVGVAPAWSTTPLVTKLNWSGTSGSLGSIAALPGSLAYVGIFPFGSVAATNYALAADGSGSDKNLYINRPTSGTIIFNEAGAGSQVQIATGGTVLISPTVSTKNAALQSSQTASGSDTTTVNLNSLIIVSDDMALTGSSSFGVGWYLNHTFGGAAMQGGRESLYVNAGFAGPSAVGNANRNYAAITGNIGTFTPDRGTNTGAGALGGMSAGNFQSTLLVGAVNWLAIEGLEVNLAINTGASAKIKYGIVIVSNGSDAVRGASYDAAIGITSKLDAGNVGFKYGILIGSASNGQWPYASDSVLIGTLDGGAKTIDIGIDLSGIGTITTAAYKSTGFTVGGTGNVSMTTLTGTSASASALAVGRLGATTPALQVDASTATSITGIKIKSAASGGGVALSAIGETNVNLAIDANGSGTITLGGTSTGAITLTRATTLSAALTYGGVTLSNAVTGTGNMVLSASPTLTGSVGLTTGSTINWNSDLFIGRRGAGNFQLGAADTASPVAQLLSVQNVATGTSDTAGTVLTVTGSRGTGTGLGGDIAFQVAPPGSTGSSQNALLTAFRATTFGTNTTAWFKVEGSASGGFTWIGQDPGSTNYTGLWALQSGTTPTNSNYLLVTRNDATDPSIYWNASTVTTGAHLFQINAVTKFQVTSAQISIIPNTASTNSTSGSLTNAGGFGNAGKIFSGDNIDVASGKVYTVAGTQVVAARRTGWTAWTGTAARGTQNADAPPTVTQVAQAFKALLDDLIAHGLVGA